MRMLWLVVLSSQCGGSSGAWLDGDSSCRFVYVDWPLSWTAALKYCRKYDLDLASIHSRTENMIVDALCPGECWIGGRRSESLAGKGTKFSWSDGTAWGYTERDWGHTERDWGRSYGRGDYIAIGSDGRWNAGGGGQYTVRKPFVCSTPTNCGADEVDVVALVVSLCVIGAFLGILYVKFPALAKVRCPTARSWAKLDLAAAVVGFVMSFVLLDLVGRASGCTYEYSKQLDDDDWDYFSDEDEDEEECPFLEPSDVEPFYKGAGPPAREGPHRRRRTAERGSAGASGTGRGPPRGPTPRNATTSDRGERRPRGDRAGSARHGPFGPTSLTLFPDRSLPTNLPDIPGVPIPLH